MSLKRNACSEYMGCTHAVMVRGHGFNAAIMVRIEFNRAVEGTVSLTSTNGHTGTRVKRAEVVYISADQWLARLFDPLDSLVWLIGRLPRPDGLVNRLDISTLPTRGYIEI